jgi:hypothetical protein
MKRFPIAALVVLGCGAATGWAQSNGEGAVAPESEVGFRWGPLSVLPSVNLSLYRDFNPTYAKPGDEKGATAFRAEPVLDLAFKGNGWGVSGRGWFSQDWYLGTDAPYRNIIERQYYGENLGFFLESPRGSRVTITESYEFQNRDDYVSALSSGGTTYNASWQDRTTARLGVALDQPLGEKTVLRAGVNYSDLEYDSDALYGWQSLGGTLGFGRKLTGKTDVLLDGGYDRQTSDGAANSSSSYRITTGLGSRDTVKSSYRATVGMMGYDYDNGSAQATTWTYGLSGAWKFSERLSGTLSGSANYQPSEVDRNNYSTVNALGAGLVFDATRRVKTTFNVVYRREDYARADPVYGETRLDNQFSLYARASYQFYRYARLFINAEFTKNLSSIGDYDYNRLFLETGLNLRF